MGYVKVVSSSNKRHWRPLSYVFFSVFSAEQKLQVLANSHDAREESSKHSLVFCTSRFSMDSAEFANYDRETKPAKLFGAAICLAA